MLTSCGLYIHIPFCLKKCAYCDFLSFGRDAFSSLNEALECEARYIKRLCLEISHLGGDQQEIDSVFIGGGTPSILASAAISQIMQAISLRFSLAPEVEISMEANPATISAEKLKEYKDAGVNRVSLGVQSLDDAVLSASGRAHGAKDALYAFDLLRDAGFSNLNVDLMAGLQGQDERSLISTLNAVCDRKPEHISFYPLILEEGTPLERAWREGRADLPDDDSSLKLQRSGIALLTERGYERYEISNFARPGYECRHNVNTWRCGAYLAAGLGASSALYDDEPGAEPPMLLRMRNYERMGDYAAAIDAGKSPAILQERVDAIGQRFERLMLGLRMMEGVSLSAFYQSFGASVSQSFPLALPKNLNAGLLLIDGDRLRLTEKGLELQNLVLIDFLLDSEEEGR